MRAAEVMSRKVSCTFSESALARIAAMNESVSVLSASATRAAEIMAQNAIYTIPESTMASIVAMNESMSVLSTSAMRAVEEITEKFSYSLPETATPKITELSDNASELIRKSEREQDTRTVNSTEKQVASDLEQTNASETKDFDVSSLMGYRSKLEMDLRGEELNYEFDAVIGDEKITLSFSNTEEMVCEWWDDPIGRQWN